MIGLIQLTTKIISFPDVHIAQDVLTDLFNQICQEFLLSSLNKNEYHKEPKIMVEFIRSTRTSQETNPIKFINKSRKVAFQLMIQITRQSSLIMANFLDNQLLPLLDQIKTPKIWNYTPPNQSERVQKYLGLKNLGCICYMNSMLQQFFMIPAFRYNLLCVEDQKPEIMVEYKNELIDDNMLHQMQYLFANLELSQRSEYNPIGFTFAFKELDGQPTLVSVQKDAQEFLNVLFDRVESILKPTSRKYLLQSIFGGKTCSQLICPECGKVKNRIEDFYNLSLTVQDSKSVYEALDRQIQGEIITDFKCDGCNKKVDITKRVLITETPNVLILHLQRILFNFDTFQNEKLNSYFEFPTYLDLKPYSYFGVMKQKHTDSYGKLEESKDDDLDSEMTQEEEEKKSEDSILSQDNLIPSEDDCFEYKLVGVNVHSGSANAGHYWSYINTVRGLEEKDGADPTWGDTAKDEWMEFNDSYVRNYNFENLKNECYGGTKQHQNIQFGNLYGKSGYMLFYERRVKKPIKIVVQDKSEGNYYDENTRENIKFIPYHQIVDDEAPCQIFSKVLLDTKFNFEKDIYSQEFIQFLQKTLTTAAESGSPLIRQKAIQVGRKAAFDILARCVDNSGIQDIISEMIKIFEQDSKLIIDFCIQIVDFQNGELMIDLLLDCTDKNTRKAIGDLFRYLLCSIKMIEKDALISDMHSFTVSHRMINILTNQLRSRALKCSSRFENYLELFEAFALNTPEQELEDTYLGIEYYFRVDMLEKLLDFVKQINARSQNAQIEPIIRLICKMICGGRFIQKYPLSKRVQKMIANEQIITKICEDDSLRAQFFVGGILKDNQVISKRVAKFLLNNLSSQKTDKIYFQTWKNFIKIDDSLKVKRIEWTLGIAQIKTVNTNNGKTKFGLEIIDFNTDNSYAYISTLNQKAAENCLLQKLLNSRGQFNDYCILLLKTLFQVCLKDQQICEYVYRMAPSCYKQASYSDWFAEYITQQCKIQSTQLQQKYLESLKVQALQRKFEKMCLQFVRPLNLEVSMIEQGDIQKQPFQYLIIRASGQSQTLITVSDKKVQVSLIELSCDYMFKNSRTGQSNSSLSDFINDTQQLQGSKSSDRMNGGIVLQLAVESKFAQTVKVSVSIETSSHTNVIIPQSALTCTVYGGEFRIMAHFMKIDPLKQWPSFIISIESKETMNMPVQNVTIPVQIQVPQLQFQQQKLSKLQDPFDSAFNYFSEQCARCGDKMEAGFDYCERCSDSNKNEGMYDDYFD